MSGSAIATCRLRRQSILWKTEGSKRISMSHNGPSPLDKLPCSIRVTSSWQVAGSSRLRSRSALRNRLEAAAARLVLAILRYAPRSVADRLGYGCARLLDRLLPRLRRTAYRNLSFAYPDRDQTWRASIVDGVFASIGRLLVSFAKFPRIMKENVHEWIGYEGLEHYT